MSVGCFMRMTIDEPITMRRNKIPFSAMTFFDVMSVILGSSIMTRSESSALGPREGSAPGR